MPLDPRTPVLVGVGSVEQRLDDPTAALEPVALMQQALERAADDAGCRELLRRADAVRVPSGFWSYRDPGRLIAESVGAQRARTSLLEIGVLQTTLLGGAARDIRAGSADVVLIAGGEAEYRQLRGQIDGVPTPETVQPEGVAPDERLRPAAELAHPAELAAGLHMPVSQYALVESALRYAEGLDVEAHRRALGRLWARFGEVAARNPHAWVREPPDAAQVVDAGPHNPMLAFPYTKLCCSQWNVDQAAGLILCSLETADALGVREERRVFPVSVAESNFMLPLCEREELARSHGFRIAGRSALEAAGRAAEDVAHLELYSCFPAAVRLQQREIGVAAERAPTVTGGMSFAGGPLNNFVLQAACRLAEILREAPDSAGMSCNAVSGYLSKQGVSLWSCRPPETGFALLDVSDEVAAATRRVQIDREPAGAAQVAACTVLFARNAPERGVLLCDTAPGRRTIVSTRDPGLMAQLTVRECCGRKLEIGAARPDGTHALSL